MAYWTIKVKNTDGVQVEYKRDGDAWIIVNVTGGNTGVNMGSCIESHDLMATIQKVMNIGTGLDLQEVRITHVP